MSAEHPQGTLVSLGGSTGFLEGLRGPFRPAIILIPNDDYFVGRNGEVRRKAPRDLFPLATGRQNRKITKLFRRAMKNATHLDDSGGT